MGPSVYLGILLAFGLMIGIFCETLLSYSTYGGDLNTNYILQQHSNITFHVHDSINGDESDTYLQVYTYTYVSKSNKTCVKQIVFQMVINKVQKDVLDSFTVTCDTLTSITANGYKIGNIAQLMVVDGDTIFRGIWAVLVTVQSTCLQKRYTDNQWRRLTPPVESRLSEQQCKTVMDDWKPLGSNLKQPQMTQSAPKLPAPLMEKVISTSFPAPNVDLDDYSYGAAQSFITVVHSGEPNNYVLVSIRYYFHKQTNECLKMVSLRLVSTGRQDRGLDSFFVSCATNTSTSSTIMTSNNFRVGNVAVILMVQGGEETGGVWTVFKMDNNICLQKRYTDNEWNKFMEPVDLNFSEERCKTVMAGGTPVGSIPYQMRQIIPEAAHQIEKVISTSISESEVDLNDYSFDAKKSLSATVDSGDSNNLVRVSLRYYFHKQTNECLKMVSLRLEIKDRPEQGLDSFFVSCVTRTSAIMTSNQYRVGDVALLLVLKGDEEIGGVWTVFKTEGNVCVQKRYTDNQWNTFRDPVPVRYADELCKRAINRGTPVGGIPYKMIQTLPEAETQIEKVLSTSFLTSNIELDNNYSLDSVRSSDSLVQSDNPNNNLRVFVKTYVHKETKECLKLVKFRLATQEKQELGSFIVSCATSTPSSTTTNRYNVGKIAQLLVVQGTIATGGVWAVLMTGKTGCVQRRYTDYQFKTVEPVDLRLSDVVCKTVMNNGIPAAIMPQMTQSSPKATVSEVEKVISTSSRAPGIDLHHDYSSGDSGYATVHIDKLSSDHLQVHIQTYINKLTKKPLKLVEFRLVFNGEKGKWLGGFMVSGDTSTPYSTTTNRYRVGSVAQLLVVKGVYRTGGVWAVFMTDSDVCLQKRYTDNQWNRILEPGEESLSRQQCQMLLANGWPVGSIPPQTEMIQTLPEIGAFKMGTVMSVGYDSSGQYRVYQDQWTKVVAGAVVKVTAIKQNNPITWECAILVLLEAEDWNKKDLCSARLTCVHSPIFTRDKGVISLNSLVYVRDEPGEAVWVVFVMQDHCVLRVYTDAAVDGEIVDGQTVDVERTLTVDQCKEVVATQSIISLSQSTDSTTSTEVGVPNMGKVISTTSQSPDIDLENDYSWEDSSSVKVRIEKSTEDHLQVLVKSYVKRRTNNVLKLVKFRLVLSGKNGTWLGGFIVSGDTSTPDSTTTNRYKVGNVAQLLVVKGDVKTGGVWAVFVTDTKNCQQKRYTDNQWNKILKPEEVSLSEQQCGEVMTGGPPVGSIPKHTQMLPTLPEVGALHMGEVLLVGRDHLDQYRVYQDEWTKAVVGAVVKVTAIKQNNPTTRECVMLVLLEIEDWKKTLGCARLTCVDTPMFTRDKGMISLNGLVYVRDERGEAIWAVFVMGHDCVLRVYTDAHHEIVHEKEKKLTWEQCSQVVAKQSIASLSDSTTSTGAGFSTIEQGD